MDEIIGDRFPSDIGTSAMLHQWNYGQFPANITDASRLLLEHGISQIKPKILDGLDYMATFDTIWDRRLGDYTSHPLSYPSRFAVAQQKKQFENAGLTFVPWVNVRGNAGPEEFDQHMGLKALGFDTIEWDLEPYEKFFVGDPDRLVEAAAAIKAAGMKLWIDAHVSRYTTRALPFERLAEYADLFLGQTYYTTFEQDPVETVIYEANYWQSIGAAAWGIILPSDGPDGYAPAVRAMRDLGGIHASLWSLNLVGPRQLAAFRDAVLDGQ